MPTYQHRTETSLTVETVEGSAEDRKYASRRSSWERVDAPPPPTASGAPTKRASKEDWAAYAISRGVPSHEAWAATKDELIEKVG